MPISTPSTCLVNGARASVSCSLEPDDLYISWVTFMIATLSFAIQPHTVNSQPFPNGHMFSFCFKHNSVYIAVIRTAHSKAPLQYGKLKPLQMHSRKQPVSVEIPVKRQFAICLIYLHSKLGYNLINQCSHADAVSRR